MPGEYAGHLRTDDPLHGYLSHYVLPNMGVTAQKVDFRVFCLKETKVYRYEESHSRTQVVGKFFANGSRHGLVAMERMRREFENLQELRGYPRRRWRHFSVPRGRYQCCGPREGRRHEDRSGGQRWRPHCLRYDSVAPGGLGSLYPCAIFEFGASASAVVRKYPGRRLRGLLLQSIFVM